MLKTINLKTSKNFIFSLTCLKKDDKIYLTAYKNILKIGYAAITLEHDKCFLNFIEIESEFQSKGVGRQMLNAIELIARKNNKNEVYGIFEPMGDERLTRKFYSGKDTDEKSVEALNNKFYDIFKLGEFYILDKVLDNSNITILNIVDKLNQREK